MDRVSRSGRSALMRFALQPTTLHLLAVVLVHRLGGEGTTRVLNGVGQSEGRVEDLAAGPFGPGRGRIRPTRAVALAHVVEPKDAVPCVLRVSDALLVVLDVLRGEAEVAEDAPGYGQPVRHPPVLDVEGVAPLEVATSGRRRMLRDAHVDAPSCQGMEWRLTPPPPLCSMPRCARSVRCR